jgi:hypothetical protein
VVVATEVTVGIAEAEVVVAIVEDVDVVVVTGTKGNGFL